MIKVGLAKREEVKKFNEREWHGVDVEHYGRAVDWNDKGFIFKAEENGEIVGTISGEHTSGVVYVDYIIVAQDKRKRGIGKLLMDKVEEFARSFNAHKLHLMTGKDWKANEFYKSLGFKKIADLPFHHFKKDFVIYEKFL